MTKPFLRAIGIALLGVGVFSGVRFRVKQEQKERPINRFELVKAALPKTGRVLIVGDSRAMRGLLSEELEALVGTSVYNFAFSAGTYQSAYLSRVESLLQFKGQVLVMGVSPWVFCKPSQDNLFQRVDKLNAIDRALLGWIWTAPYPFRDKIGEYTFECRAGGSLLSPVLVHPPLTWPDRRSAKSLQAQEAYVVETLSWISKQVKKGVRVIVLRVPTSDQFEQEDVQLLEGRLQNLWARIDATGAEVILPPTRGWETMDGEHLSPASAQRLTEFIAARIKR